MSFATKPLTKYLLLFLMLAVGLTMVGCNSGGDVLEGTDYTVIYDGNGGYLGNKTYTIRKLQVVANSKLPKYLDEYTQDPYVVSSLGLAMRDGYNLLGWYESDQVVYEENEFGQWVYLDNDEGNGLYVIDEAGEYVYGYVEDPEGEYIFILVEEVPTDVDPADVEYIYYQGAQGYGYYIYDNEDPDHIAVFEADGSYTVDDVDTYGTYLLYDDLTPEEQAFFVDIPRLTQAFYPYTDADEGLTRYTYQSGYADYNALLVEDANGIYVMLLDGTIELYDSENPDHDALDRYSIDDKYVFTASATYELPSDLPRYDAAIEYWDFENDRVTHDMVLYAHWEKKLSVNFVQKTGQVTVMTEKLNPDHTSSVPLAVGETIGRLETIPLYVGYTFVGWSTSEEEYLPWDFDNDVFPENVTTLVLYAFMIEGTYTRITSASGLANVALNPSGNYLLVKNIDLGGAVYSNASPLGFSVKTAVGSPRVAFTGSFVSMGYSISNFTINVSNLQKLINEADAPSVALGLFPYIQDATIDGLIVSGMTINFSTVSNATSIVCEMGAAGIAGEVFDGASTISNVSVDILFTQSTADQSTYPVYIGDVVAKGIDYVVISNSTAVIDYTAVQSITTGTLSVETLE